MTIEPGPGFVARLRDAFRDTPAARRVVVHGNDSSATYPPSLGEEGVGDDAVGVVAVPMSDTVKEVIDGTVRRTVPRETLVQVVGPWVFTRQALADALAAVAGGEAEIPDMIGFCEAAHVRVRVLPAR